ncbi:phage tail tape measure protein [Clostridium botulinum]|uniref:phage tail tape measure protein n=1 Tax=Clostridium botulinum TaxID=1491 RepID=UPI001E511601|nr:phage tail tape measure protein [Clostridium botulinum]MCD3252454.1 phage tail tape measure protein [Clostridium botulinum C/D]MCD3277882.1 phage tail tape measure protein [Clostridium botulinum C/D]MCD3281235.1 phage tail tape measure protein [Clostridium botulinum C/D]MCD3340266.1 phage tail tape measure protein [Clostridium botulinum C/D]MCD3355808.1 phage tail tape measure protein [Clostridium botulinum C/D]
MAETYGIQLGVEFNFEEAKQNLNKIINDLQKDCKLNIKLENVNFDKIINDYKNLQRQLQSNGIKLNTNGLEEIDKVSNRIAQANDSSRKIIYNQERERLRTITDTQKKIEQIITGSNETIAQQQGRMNRLNGQQYEQIWLRALKEKEQKAIQSEERIAQAEQKRIQKLGQERGFASSGMFSDDTYIKSQIQSIYGADASIKNYKRSLDSAGNSQIKMTVATQSTNNQIKEYGVTIDRNTQKIYQNSEAIKVNNKHIASAFERMGNSIKQAVSMAVTMGSMYKGVQKCYEAVQVLISLDQQMVQVREITGMTQQQTDKLMQSYSKMSVNLATTLTDMSKLTVELTRQGLAIDETNKRMQIFSKFNKVINGDINQSTELMTAGINSLQVDAQELSDVLVKVGAVSGTSAQEVGAIIQKSGAMAKEGKISLQELATMGAIVSEKTRESGKVLPS